MRPIAHTFGGVDVPGWTGIPELVEPSPVVVVQLEVEDTQVARQVTIVDRPDDYRRDSGLLERPA